MYFFELKKLKYLFFGLPLLFCLELLPVLAQSYSPPPMEPQKPQRATISGSRGRGSCPYYQDSITPLFPKAENIITALAQPVFIFQLNSSLNNPAYFSLIANDEIYPLYEQKIESLPSQLLVIKIPQEVKLALNTTYRVNLVIVCNDKKPSYNWSFSTKITRIALPTVVTQKVEREFETIARAVILSRGGFWFDALALISSQGLVNNSTFEKLLENYKQEPE